MSNNMIFDKGCSLSNLELVKTDAGNYYLHATYIVEDGTCISEIDIPKVYLPIHRDRVAIIHEHHIPYSHMKGADEYIVDLGYGKQRISCDEENCGFTIGLIEEKVHKLTVSEIEKKLGYKIEIVSGDEKGVSN